MNDLVGNLGVKKALAKLIETDTASGALLFSGPAGIGKGLFALAFAKQLLGKENHPDLHLYKPEGKIGMHSIASIRQLIEEVFLPPYEGVRKAFIVYDADRMLPESANALLKTLEEPTLDALLILISSSSDKLLPTIRSRCRKIHFQPISSQDIASYLCLHHSLSAQEAERIAWIARGSLARAIRYLDPATSQRRDTVLQILAGPKNYPSLLQALRELNAQMESQKKVWAEAAAKEYDLESKDTGRSAAHQEVLQKEADGFAASLILQEVEEIFDTVLSWYRDKELMACGGSSDQLFHREWAPQMSKNSDAASLEKVMQKIEEARTSFARSTPFLSLFETLFLSLQ